ncbi:MAG: phosphatase PAP2 family protein [Acidovorax sp.]
MTAISPPSSTALPPPWRRQLGPRLTCLWPLKALGTALFITAFFQAYFFVLRNPGPTVWIMPTTWVDRQVGFTPLALPVYASLWVYVSLPAALLGNLRGLLRHGFWIALMCAACLGVFWTFPTKVPAAALDWASHPGMSLLKNVDNGGNACPSLHVASAVFAAYWLRHIFAAMRAPRGWTVASDLFCAAIAWSTLATLQHVALDALAGALVGALFAWLSLRQPGSTLDAPQR